MPVAADTIFWVMPTAPHRPSHLAPIAVWFACPSMLMVRALGRTPNTCRQRTCAILAFSNAGEVLGVLVWLHPAHAPSTASWIIVGTLLLIIRKPAVGRARAGQHAPRLQGANHSSALGIAGIRNAASVV